MRQTIRFPHRRKHDGTDDTMCLACFKTISGPDSSAPSLKGSQPVRLVEEHDHICAFAFPDRRANDLTFEDSPKRRRSDMEWQALISREALLPTE